jgi:AcrR family transcriptional regulator
VRKGEQTRQEIIRKAAPIFNQKGYDGAALSDLMRATGLEKSEIYRHFGSKQELVGDAFDYAWKLAVLVKNTSRRDATELSLLSSDGGECDSHEEKASNSSGRVQVGSHEARVIAVRGLSSAPSLLHVQIALFV